MREVKILVIADQLETYNKIVEPLDWLENSLVWSDGSGKGIKDFDQYRPQIVLLARDPLALSQAFYVKLFRSSEKVHSTPHRSVLLCAADDASRAARLCKQAKYYDYLPFEPHYDHFRLGIILEHALEELSLEDKNDSEKAILSQTSEVITNFDAAIKEVLADKSTLKRGAEKSFAWLSSQIHEAMRAFSQELSHSEYSELVKVLDVKRLENKFEEFSAAQLEEKVGNTGQQVGRALSDWVDKLETGYHRHEQAVSHLRMATESIQQRVLIVEDDEIYGDIVKTILETNGYEVELTGSVVQGLTRMVCQPPSLVLLDYELPDMTGQEFLRKARELDSLKNIPVIMLTSHSGRDIVEKTIQSGADDFIVKPADRELLIKKVRANIA